MFYMWLVLDQPCGRFGPNNNEIHLTLGKKERAIAPLATPLYSYTQAFRAHQCSTGNYYTVVILIVASSTEVTAP